LGGLVFALIASMDCYSRHLCNAKNMFQGQPGKTPDSPDVSSARNTSHNYVIGGITRFYAGCNLGYARMPADSIPGEFNRRIK